MSIEKDKNMLVRFTNEAINGNSWDQIDEYVGPGAFDNIVPPGMPRNIEGVKMFFGALHSAMPDLKFTPRDTLREGDLIAQHVTGEGTMTGPLFGMQPTGKHAQWDELHVARIEDGKIVEHWGNVDQMSMMMQLGLVQTPGANQEERRI
jgi:predicted ester cyclase